MLDFVQRLDESAHKYGQNRSMVGDGVGKSAAQQPRTHQSSAGLVLRSGNTRSQ